MMALFGASSGPVPAFEPILLNSKGSLFLTRPTLWHYIATRAELEWRAGDILGWAAKGELKLRTEFTYPLANAAQAQIDLEERKDHRQDFAGAVEACSSMPTISIASTDRVFILTGAASVPKVLAHLPRRGWPLGRFPEWRGRMHARRMAPRSYCSLGLLLRAPRAGQKSQSESSAFRVSRA